MKKYYLYAPGPTAVPDEVLAALAKPILHHRTPQFSQMIERIRQDLKPLFQTKQEVMIFAASGTGAMEGTVANLLSPGDTAITVEGGKFGQRWGQLCQAYSVKTIIHGIQWRETVKPEDVEQLLSQNPETKAVFTQLVETSTGVLNDIKALAEVTAKTDAVLVVDTVSSLGADEFRMDEWGVDVNVAGSQKAMMLPPGLAFVAVSEKAWNLVEVAKSPRYYFDFRKQLKSQQKNSTPYTPAISLIYGLRVSLDMIKAEGMEAIWARHARLAKACRAGVTALGLELLAERPANGVTAVKIPEGVDGNAFLKDLRDIEGITIAGGQEHLKGHIFRIAHMGWSVENDVLTALAGVERALAREGYKIEPGAALAAAQSALL